MLNNSLPSYIRRFFDPKYTIPVSTSTRRSNQGWEISVTSPRMENLRIEVSASYVSLQEATRIKESSCLNVLEFKTDALRKYETTAKEILREIYSIEEPNDWLETIPEQLITCVAISFDVFSLWTS